MPRGDERGPGRNRHNRTMIQRLAAYAVVRDGGGRILMCRLAPPLFDRGKWTLPGGGLEFGEHPEAAVVREVREETGYDVRVKRLLEIQSDVYENPRGALHAIRFVYAAEIVGGHLAIEQDGSTDLAAWHTHHEAKRLPKVALANRGVMLAFGRG